MKQTALCFFLTLAVVAAGTAPKQAIAVPDPQTPTLASEDVKIEPATVVAGNEGQIRDKRGLIGLALAKKAVIGVGLGALAAKSAYVAGGYGGYGYPGYYRKSYYPTYYREYYDYPHYGRGYGGYGGGYGYGAGISVGVGGGFGYGGYGYGGW